MQSRNSTNIKLELKPFIYNNCLNVIFLIRIQDEENPNPLQIAVALHRCTSLAFLLLQIEEFEKRRKMHLYVHSTSLDIMFILNCFLTKQMPT